MSFGEEASSAKAGVEPDHPWVLKKDRPVAWDAAGNRISPNSRLGRLGEPVFARKG